MLFAAWGAGAVCGVVGLYAYALVKQELGTRRRKRRVAK